jgi:hypothetical protein
MTYSNRPSINSRPFVKMHKRSVFRLVSERAMDTVCMCAPYVRVFWTKWTTVLTLVKTPYHRHYLNAAGPVWVYSVANVSDGNNFPD